LEKEEEEKMTRKACRSFDNAKKFVQKLKLKNYLEWQEYCTSGNKPDDIPSRPDVFYKNIFIGYGNWLGTGRIAPQNRKFRSFTNTRKFVQKLNLRGQSDWNEYSKSNKKPKDIPANPRNTYKEHWTSWGDFLGTGNIGNDKKTYCSFEEAKKFVKGLGLKGEKEWKEYCISGNKPDDIPSTPWLVYKKWNIERMKRNEKKV
jgi:hypothetical protein